MADRYAEIFAAHRWNVPPQFNIAQACCARWANDRSRIALHWEDESGATAAFTFSDLQQQANRLSNALAALGIGRGDKIALILPQRPETVVAHLAAYQLGAIAVPLSFLFGPEALSYRLIDSGAKVALVDPQSLPNLALVRE
jgi:acetyl-CoA synthetase